MLVTIGQSVAYAGAFTGLVAAFWHIVWFAGVAVMVSGLVAIGIHSAGSRGWHWTVESHLKAPRGRRFKSTDAQPDPRWTF